MLGPSGSGTSFSTGSNVFGDLAGVGTDTFVSGVSRVRGSEFGDVITGNGGTNTLEGQGGNDVLSGFAGSDTLTGGTGARHIFCTDTQRQPAGADADIVTDFNPDEGDRIDLRAISTVQACRPWRCAGVAATPSLLLTARQYSDPAKYRPGRSHRPGFHFQWPGGDHRPDAGWLQLRHAL